MVDAVQLAIPWFVGYAIDEIAKSPSTAPLAYIGLIVLGVSSVGLIFRFLWRFFLVGSARRIEREVRSKFFRHLLTLSAPYYNRTKTGDLMAHATNDIDAIMRACGFGTLTMADAVFMSIATMIFMGSISIELMLYAIIPLPFVCLVVLGFGRLIHRRFEQVQAVFSVLMEKVREALSGVRVVKSYVQERGMESDYKITNQEFVDKNVKLAKIFGLFDPSIAFLSGLGTAIVLWAGGTRVITGEITIGDFARFTMYLTMLVWPMMALGFTVNVLQRGAASMNRITRIFDTEAEIKSPHRKERLPDSTDLTFRNLTFSYLPDQTVLQGINLELEAGKTLGIVGPVGSGKSTLVHLIPRQFDPPPGSVLLGGIDVRNFNLQDLRSKIGMVPQDPFLFSNTLRENIRLADPDADEASVIRAAELAGMTSDIARFPKGLDTVVGERGVSLSGGQKQRMGIARALLSDPDILILDDCLSAVDAEKEEEILGNLRDVLASRTAIVIAHRISAVQEADWIIVLDEQGHINEEGRHDELIQNGGFYQKLYQMQQAQQAFKHSNLAAD
jgi:ATP-binding cassette subfamily B protein